MKRVFLFLYTFKGWVQIKELMTKIYSSLSQGPSGSKYKLFGSYNLQHKDRIKEKNNTESMQSEIKWRKIKFIWTKIKGNKRRTQHNLYIQKKKAQRNPQGI